MPTIMGDVGGVGKKDQLPDITILRYNHNQ